MGPRWFFAALPVVLVLLAQVFVEAQDGRETDPAASLTAALSAACRGNEAEFEN